MSFYMHKWLLRNTNADFREGDSRTGIAVEDTKDMNDDPILVYNHIYTVADVLIVIVIIVGVSFILGFARGGEVVDKTRIFGKKRNSGTIETTHHLIDRHVPTHCQQICLEYDNEASVEYLSKGQICFFLQLQIQRKYEEQIVQRGLLHGKSCRTRAQWAMQIYISVHV